MITTDNAKNAIDLKVTGLDCNVVADFSFKYIVTVKGSATIKIKNVSAEFLLGLTTQAGTPSTELAPMLSVLLDTITINPNDIDITLSGSAVAKIASIFVPLIKNSIIPSIIKTVQDTLKTTIEGTVDQDLALYGDQIVIPYLAGVTFDYAQMAGPVVEADGTLEMTLNGTFFDADQAAPCPFPYFPAAFNVRNPAGKDIQTYMTDYTINTALLAGFQTGNTLDITYLLQNFLNLTVTTDNLALIVPEILTKYGSGKAVSISGAFVNSASEVHFATASSTIDGFLGFTITIDGETAIQGELNGIAAAGVLSSAAGVIYGDISKHSVGTVDKFVTSLGITVDQFTTELQTFVDTYISQANTALAAGIVIPTIKGVDISDIEINITEGLTEFGISATPTLFEQVGAAMTFMSAEATKIRSGAFKVAQYQSIFETLFLQ